MKHAGCLLVIVTLLLMFVDIYLFSCSLDFHCSDQASLWEKCRHHPFCALRDVLRVLMSRFFMQTPYVLVELFVLLCFLFFSRDVSRKNAHHLVWRIVVFYVVFRLLVLPVAGQLFLACFYENAFRYDMMRMICNVQPYAIWFKKSKRERICRFIITIAHCVFCFCVVPCFVAFSLLQYSQNKSSKVFAAAGGFLLLQFLACIFMASTETVMRRNVCLSSLLCYIKTTSYDDCMDREFLVPFYTVSCYLLFIRK